MCMHIHTFALTHTYTHIHTRTQTLSHTHTHIHAYTHACTHTLTLSNTGDGDATPREVHHTTLSRFLPTSRRLVQFSNSRVAPEDARIVYIDGAFDAFHPGHVKILKVCLRAHARMCEVHKQPFVCLYPGVKFCVSISLYPYTLHPDVTYCLSMLL